MLQVEAEVLRLEELKASKMKELVLKKRSELEEICRRTHLVAETDPSMDFAIEAIESGMSLIETIGMANGYYWTLLGLYHYMWL